MVPQQIAMIKYPEAKQTSFSHTTEVHQAQLTGE
jgi:hypothetical protein